ncbi:MAG: hypothetical protein ACJ74O_11590 [Frankiaceae bacterium]
MSDAKRTDLVGRELSADEAALLDAYGALRGLAADGALAPCVTANVRHALAALAQAVNDLGLAYEHLLDVGV